MAATSKPHGASTPGRERATRRRRLAPVAPRPRARAGGRSDRLADVGVAEGTLEQVPRVPAGGEREPAHLPAVRAQEGEHGGRLDLAVEAEEVRRGAPLHEQLTEPSLGSRHEPVALAPVEPDRHVARRSRDRVLRVLPLGCRRHPNLRRSAHSLVDWLDTRPTVPQTTGPEAPTNRPARRRRRHKPTTRQPVNAGPGAPPWPTARWQRTGAERARLATLRAMIG